MASEPDVYRTIIDSYIEHRLEKTEDNPHEAYRIGRLIEANAAPHFDDLANELNGTSGPAASASDMFVKTRSGILCMLHPQSANCRDVNHLHHHDFFELIYVYRGSCQQLFRNSRVTMQEGSFCLLNTHAEHGIAIEDAHDAVFNILISETFFTRVLKKMIPYESAMGRFFWASFFERAAHEHIVFEANPKSDAGRFAQALITESIDSLPGKQQAMAAYLSLLFCELMRNHGYRMTSTDERAGLCSDVLGYIDNHLAEASPTTVAQHFGYSTGYLSRTVKEFTGKTMVQFCMELKLGRAAEYLEQTALSIDDIANRMGFYDRSHFNKAFKRHYGITPTAYRLANQHTKRHAPSTEMHGASH